MSTERFMNNNVGVLLTTHCYRGHLDIHVKYIHLGYNVNTVGKLSGTLAVGAKWRLALCLPRPLQEEQKPFGDTKRWSSACWERGK